uniref:LAGLIDADG endonuclease n=1 Tax=Fusarium pseudonygamai TaxID=47755 RepID=A0A6M4B1S0_9HYPO|nr:LAGLIDADG endonuclease [Fusarium pseudonygamai]
MIMRGVKLLYFKLSYKLKWSSTLKDNLIEKYLNNLLLKPSINNISYPLKPELPPHFTQKEFIEWFVGFTDGEGCFSIRIPNEKTISLIFTIELHKDDVEVLHKIANGLGVGRVLVNKNKDSALFFISKFEDINSVLIPLFKNFPLQTTKHLDFISFAEAASIIFNSRNLKKKLSLLELEKIIDLKQSINTKRLIINEEENKLLVEKVCITKWWLLGFIEGEGTFGYKHLVPYFQIAQNKKNLFVLKAIEAYLKEVVPSLINSENKELEFKYNLNKLTGVYSMTLEKVDDNFYHLIPFFESLTFLSRKSLDYEWWVLSVFIHKLGYFYLPEGKQIALQISSSTNKYRYTTAKDSLNKIGLPNIESILNLFKQTPPFDISSHRSHFELVREFTVAKGGRKGFLVHIYECNSTLNDMSLKEVKDSPFSTYGDGHEVLGLKRGSRVIGRYIDTGKLYRDKYRFSSIPLK